VIDLQTMGVKDVLSIGQTTDHALLSPDGREVWFTTNAEHAIYIYDTKTTSMTVVKDPADGDIHGGVWVQYSDDGKGGVKGEVVADYAGLHGSALAAQRAYVAKPTLQIALNGSGFTQKAINAETGKAYRVVVKNAAGTSAGKITFESADLGIKTVTLLAGESQEFTWTAPAAASDLSAKTNKAPNSALKITVKAAAAAAAPAANATPADDVKNVIIKSEKLQWNIESIAVKPGQKVHFEFTNGDDEKHNLVGLGEGLNFLSPDIPAGAKASYDWVAPATPVKFTVVCAYHPKMTFTVDVK
jgi:plastocyanin